jgi:hypothetical protein
MERSVNQSWPWPAVLTLAFIALVAAIVFPFFLLILLPVAAVALTVWGYVSYRHAEPGTRAMPAAAMAAGIALLAIIVLAVAGLTATSTSVDVTSDTPAPIAAPMR